jgi:hypothetical protein
VVDVGGGIGASTLPLAKAFLHLRYTIQDREAVIPEAEKVRRPFNDSCPLTDIGACTLQVLEPRTCRCNHRWRSHYPKSLSSLSMLLHLLTLVDAIVIVHDFFGTQPIKNAKIFFLRFVLHDWPDVKAREILKQLRASASSNTKLLLLETITPYACPSSDVFVGIPGAEVPPAPAPLIPNLGVASAFAFISDMQVCMTGPRCRLTTNGLLVDDERSMFVREDYWSMDRLGGWYWLDARVDQTRPTQHIGFHACVMEFGTSKPP